MSKYEQDTEKLVMAIKQKDNVKAYKLLEKVIKQKISDKIDQALADEA